jgi:hypothetical protein
VAASSLIRWGGTAALLGACSAPVSTERREIGALCFEKRATATADEHLPEHYPSSDRRSWGGAVGQPAAVEPAENAAPQLHLVYVCHMPHVFHAETWYSALYGKW